MAIGDWLKNATGAFQNIATGLSNYQQAGGQPAYGIQLQNSNLPIGVSGGGLAPPPGYTPPPPTKEEPEPEKEPIWFPMYEDRAGPPTSQPTQEPIQEPAAEPEAEPTAPITETEPTTGLDMATIDAYYQDLIDSAKADWGQTFGDSMRRAEIMGNKMGFSIGGGGQASLFGSAVVGAQQQQNQQMRQLELQKIDAMIGQDRFEKAQDWTEESFDRELEYRYKALAQGDEQFKEQARMQWEQINRVTDAQDRNTQFALFQNWLDQSERDVSEGREPLSFYDFINSSGVDVDQDTLDSLRPPESQGDGKVSYKDNPVENTLPGINLQPQYKENLNTYVKQYGITPAELKTIASLLPGGQYHGIWFDWDMPPEVAAAKKKLLSWWKGQGYKDIF